MHTQPLRGGFWACASAQLFQSHPTLCDPMDCITHPAPLSGGSSHQEYLSGSPHPPPEDLADPGIEPVSVMSPALAGRFVTSSAIWEVELIPNGGTSLAVQWLRLCLPMQGVWVQSLLGMLRAHMLHGQKTKP